MALLYSAQHGTQTNGQGFFSQGGTLQLTFGLFGRLTAVAEVNAEGNSNVNQSGVAVGQLTTSFGPHYRFTEGRVSLFGEGLAGLVHGVAGLYPVSGSLQASAVALSTQAGGGVDLRHSLYSIWPIQVDWVRTQLPNGGNNVQNQFRLSAGIVFRLSR